MTLIRARRLAHIGLHAALIPLMLACSAIVAWTAGDYHWPYKVESVDVEPDPIHPGGSVRITTVRYYFADCDLLFERSLESVHDKEWTPVLLPSSPETTPWRLNGKPETVRISVPPNFPCGAAQVRTRPSASCNWLQHGPLRQSRGDVLTPFEVSCPALP